MFIPREIMPWFDSLKKIIFIRVTEKLSFWCFKNTICWLCRFLKQLTFQRADADTFHQKEKSERAAAFSSSEKAVDILISACFWFTAQPCSVCSATRRNPIPCLIGRMVFPQQKRGVGFSGREARRHGGGEGWHPSTPRRGGLEGTRQITLPCMDMQSL